MALPKKAKSHSVYELLAQEMADSTIPLLVNVKLLTGDIFEDATLLDVAGNGITILDSKSTPPLKRFIPEYGTAHISVVQS